MLGNSSGGQRSGRSFPGSFDKDPSQNYSAGVVWNHGCLTVEQEDALSLTLTRAVVGRTDFFMDCGSGVSVSYLLCEHFCRAVPKIASLLHSNQTARECERVSHTKENGSYRFISISTLLPYLRFDWIVPSDEDNREQ